MKTEHIIIGQKYGHKNYEEVIYLGCYLKQAKSNGFKIISDNYKNYSFVGAVVNSEYSSRKSIAPDFWDGFYILNDNYCNV